MIVGGPGRGISIHLGYALPEDTRPEQSPMTQVGSLGGIREGESRHAKRVPRFY
ncbi:MAG: hypothetical protein H6666_11455 [Ardenticatenaceae bacterium]|nr:hypothetical protein [Anaerolineales bacterium]MCB8918525.1 hypothetical protein [Ardenticatenaceae bacterium]